MDPGLVSRDAGRPSVPDTDAQSETSGENPQGETKARAVIKRYYSVMDDEGADDVFIPPPPLPPSSSALLLPAEGSTGGMVNNSSVTHSTGATDATEARANPGGLDWHHGERQLMAAQTKVDEVIARTAQTSEECMDATSLSSIKVLTPPTDEDQTSSEDTGCLMETCHEPSGKESDEEAGDVGKWTETEEEPVNSKPVKGNVDRDRAGTIVPTLPGLTGKDDDSEPSGPETPAEETNSDEEHVDTRSLSYKLTKSDWVRRESGSSETQVSQQPNSEGSEGTTRTRGEQGDGSKRIATDIQQGEQLLQRLQLVQQRQDGQMMEVAQETRGKEQGEFEVDPREVNLTDGAEMQEKRIHSVVDEGAKGKVTEKEKNESKKERVSLSTMSDDAEEADDSDDDQSDRWEPADPHENPHVSTHHRFSAADASVEKQIQEERQAKQNLQRSGAVFNLTDNPDVLEIPFKTNILLEPLPSQVDQRSDWQFSEHKMQKEISQEIQRELVLVSQGKIPGGYSKEEIRKLEETKLLFEAFQQDNTEGPTRLRKHPTTLTRGDVNPSVLERTCSLERFSLESSLRLHESETSEKTEKSPDYLRSKSPTGGLRDKTRLSPYAKQDKHPRLCRSMDSINSDVSTSAAEARIKTREGRDSPILQRNPFFKLRPALALQPEVEKDIRQAREREEELRRQRCTLYGEDRTSSQDEEKSGVTKTLVADVRKQSRGKLERVWPPPPSRKDQQKSEQSQQEPKVQRAGGQKAPLWQRWESGQINGEQPSQENT